MRKCKVIVQHSFRLMSREEIKKKKIKSQGIGIWICTNCGKIKHSM